VPWNGCLSFATTAEFNDGRDESRMAVYRSGMARVKAGQARTGWRGYFGMVGAAQRRNELRAPRTRWRWAQVWHRLSGNGEVGG